VRRTAKQANNSSRSQTKIYLRIYFYKIKRRNNLRIISCPFGINKAQLLKNQASFLAHNVPRMLNWGLLDDG
jgi:hypothetical protein